MNIKNIDWVSDPNIKPQLREIVARINDYYSDKHQLIITSAYREGDTRNHGKGQAVDITLEGYYLHIFQYCIPAWEITENYCKENDLGYEFRIYEGLDNDKKYKQHFHLGINFSPGYIAVTTGDYKG